MLRPAKIFYGLLLCLLFWVPVYAQLKCKIVHYSAEDGLSHNRINCMLKDRDGFMWFGTWNGLNRFDGHNFIVYKSRPGDTTSLQNDRIQEMVEDKQGYLWLRPYDNRIYRFDKAKEQFLAIDIKKPGTNVAVTIGRIFLSHTGQIWLTTANNGIYLIPDPDAPHPHYIWFATTSAAAYRLPSNEMTYFYEDQDANVWLSTTAGVCCLRRNGQKVEVDASLHGPSGQSITAIAGTHHKIWMASATGDLFCLDKTSRAFTSVKAAASAVNRIFEAKHNNDIYLTTQGGELVAVDRNTMQVSSFKSPRPGSLRAMYEDRRGLLWIAPEDKGILKFDPSKHAFKYFEQVIDADYKNTSHFFRLNEDKNGLLWVSMENGGFGYYNAEKDSVEYFYNKPGTSDKRFSNIVICSYADQSGILWFSPDDKGLDKVVVEPDNFRHQLVAPHSTIRWDNEIRGIGSDRLGRVWAASRSGSLFVYKSGAAQKIAFNNLPADGLGVIYKIMQDAQGAMWLGTKGKGLYRAEPVDANQTTYRLSHFEPDKNDPYSLNSNIVYDIFEDNAKRIWVATYENGLSLVVNRNGKTAFLNDVNTFKSYPKSNFRKIRHLQEDGAGRLWIGTTDGLLVSQPIPKALNQLRFTAYTRIPGNVESLGNNDVQYIYRAKNGRMWIATAGGGLNEAVGNDPSKSLKFKVFTTANGLPNDYVLSCIEDQQNHLWLATENGLSCFTPSTGKFKNYDSVDGLPGAGFSEASVTALTGGWLAFGCINGFTYFNPAQLAAPKIAAKMVFTNLQVNNADIAAGDATHILQNNINQTTGINLKYNQNIVGLDFAALDFRSNDRLEYAYRLRNFDDSWHINKGLRRVVYTNLPPGNYELEVKCINTGLYVTEPYKSLSIHITPPWWKTWWAYLCYAIILIIAGEIARRIAFTMLRLRQRVAVEKKLADLKMNFFTNVSHELRTPLTLILNPIEEIFKKERLSNEASAHIQVVRKNARRMVYFINQLLDLRKVQSGKAVLHVSQVDIKAFVKKIGEYFNDAAAEKHINLQVIADENLQRAWIDADKMDVVIYNLLSNAFKFSPPDKNITLHISEQPGGRLAIAITDEGKGVPEDQLRDIFELYYEGQHTDSKHAKGTGIGLALCKEFVELHQGQIAAHNNVNGGLTVTITLLQGDAHFDKDKVIFADEPELSEPRHELTADISTQLPALEQDTSTDKPLVLLVEDHQELRSFLSFQLNEFYRVAVAVNGLDGLTKAKTLLPDLILSDVMMPEMDGITMLDKLKNDIQTSHIPVVILSAKFSIESQIEGLKYGADYYITKPFHNDFLMVAIDNLIKQRKQLFKQLVTSEKMQVDLSPSEITITTQDQQFLKKIIQVVEDGMTDPDFNIDNVADSMNMGRSTFYRKFKSLTGQPPVEFVREMRLKRAGQLMDAGEHNIAEIAYSVGFNNAKYFSTCFKDYYQLTPSEYLKKSQEARSTQL